MPSIQKPGVNFNVGTRSVFHDMLTPTISLLRLFFIEILKPKEPVFFLFIFPISWKYEILSGLHCEDFRSILVIHLVVS